MIFLEQDSLVEIDSCKVMIQGKWYWKEEDLRKVFPEGLQGNKMSVLWEVLAMEKAHGLKSA